MLSDRFDSALLHDSIEDRGDRYPGGRDALRAEIAAQFGPEVLEIVDACTDDERYNQQEARAWKQRKQAYIVRFATGILVPNVLGPVASASRSAMPRPSRVAWSKTTNAGRNTVMVADALQPHQSAKQFGDNLPFSLYY